MSKTPRDEIYRVIYNIDRIETPRITVDYVREEAEVELSQYTVRHALKGLAEVGILKHKDGSPYWYVL